MTLLLNRKLSIERVLIKNSKKEIINKKYKEYLSLLNVLRWINESKVKVDKEEKVEKEESAERETLKKIRLKAQELSYSNYCHIQSNKLVSNIIRTFLKYNKKEWIAYKTKGKKEKGDFIIAHKEKLQKVYHGKLNHSQYIKPISLGNAIKIDWLKKLKVEEKGKEIANIKNKKKIYKYAIMSTLFFEQKTKKLGLKSSFEKLLDGERKIKKLVYGFIKSKMEKMYSKMLSDQLKMGKMLRTRSRGVLSNDAKFISRLVKLQIKHRKLNPIRKIKLNPRDVIRENKYRRSVETMGHNSNRWNSNYKKSRYKDYSKVMYKSWEKKLALKWAPLSFLHIKYRRYALVSSIINKLSVLTAFKNKVGNKIVRIKMGKGNLMCVVGKGGKIKKAEVGKGIFIDKDIFYRGYVSSKMSVEKMIKCSADNIYQSILIYPLISNLNNGNNFFEGYFKRMGVLWQRALGPKKSLLNKMNKMLFNDEIKENRIENEIEMGIVKIYKNVAFGLETDEKKGYLVQKEYKWERENGIKWGSQKYEKWADIEWMILKGKWLKKEEKWNRRKSYLESNIIYDYIKKFVEGWNKKVIEEAIISWTSDQYIELNWGDLESNELLAKEAGKEEYASLLGSLRKQERNGRRYKLESSAIGKTIRHLSLLEDCTSIMPDGLKVEKGGDVGLKYELTLKEIQMTLHVYKNLFTFNYTTWLLDDYTEKTKAVKKKQLGSWKTSLILEAKSMHKFLLEQYYLCKIVRWNSVSNRIEGSYKKVYGNQSIVEKLRREKGKGSPYDLMLSTRINLPKVQRIKRSGSELLNGHMTYKTNEYFRKNIYRTVLKEKRAAYLEENLYFWFINWNRLWK